MADAELTWGGLTLGGTSAYIVSEITGWDDLPETSDYSEARSRAHGDHLGDQFSRARIVGVTGKIADVANRDTLARALAAVSTVSSAVSDLAIEMLGMRLTAGARVFRRSLATGLNYSVGEIPFALQWRCADPLRYGAAVGDSAGLPVVTGGLAYALAYPLAYGASGANGQLTLTNPGTAPTPIVFTVSGSLPNGFQLSALGQRLTYPQPVFTGQPVVIDTGAGTVLVEGTADRRSYLTTADWIQVPAGGSITVQFTSLGGAFDPAALVSATARPAYW